MGKTQVSVSLDMNCYIQVREIAKRSFNKNFSATLNWLIYSLMKKENFYKFMAKHHAAQMTHFKELLDQQKGEEPEQRVIQEIEI